MLTQCPNCQFTYVSDVPADILAHKEAHARWEEPTLPVHCPSLHALRNDLASALLVNHGAPLWKHKHMYRCARAFNHEMHFNSVPWPDPDIEKIDLSSPVRREGQLIGDSEGKVFGAACFELGFLASNGQKYWWLNWVWLAPSERRQGHLMARWGDWISRYGQIAPAPPISDAMKTFLQRIDWKFPGIDRDAILKL